MIQTLATITLDENVSVTPVSSTAFSIMTNWTASGGLETSTIVGQTSSELDWENQSSNTVGSVLSPVFSPDVDGTNYGQAFRVTMTLQNLGSADVTAQVIARRSGVDLGILSNTHTLVSGAGATSFNFDFTTSGTTFDQIKFKVTNGDGAVYEIDMTVVSISSIETSFASGDRIFCQWDDSGNTQITKWESNPGATVTTITHGPTIQSTAIAGVVGINSDDPAYSFPRYSNYTVCNGTTLRRWTMLFADCYFPYAIENDIANDASCSVSAPICALTFTPPFTITPPTSPYTNDATVFLTTEGANGLVRYAQSDIYYAAMSNTTGTVSGLSVGTYTFYARDQYNCGDSIDITIEPNYSYSTLYRVEWNSVIDKKACRVDILERSYSGAVNDITGGSGTPFNLAKNQGTVNDKFDVIRNTRGSITMLSNRNFQFIGLFSQDDQKYQVKYYKDYGSGLTLEWIGFIAPSLFSEDYIPTPYPTTITVTDNLITLKNEDFTDVDGNHFVGRLKLIKIIALILKKTGLSINIYCGINKFAQSHSTGGNNDPLDQTYIDVASFYEDDGTPWNCERVLKAILAPFGAFVIQQSAVWWLIESEAQYTSYNYRVFNSDGDVQSNSTFNPIQQITAPVYQFGQIFTGGDAKLSIQPSYGKIKLIHNLITKSIFPESMDEGWAANSAGSLGYAQTYTVPDSLNKGVSFYGLDAGMPTPPRSLFDLGDVPAFNGVSWISPVFAATIQNDSLQINFDHRTVLSIPYDPAQNAWDNHTINPPWTEYAWQLILNYGASAFFYSETIGWNQPTGSTTFTNIQSKYNFSTNFFYEEAYSSDFTNFKKDIPLPVFVSPTDVTIQLKLFFAGTFQERYFDYTGGGPGLKTIPTLNLPVGSRITGLTGTTPSDGMYWYVLENNTSAESHPSIVRPDDYNSGSNPVQWIKNDGFDPLFINVFLYGFGRAVDHVDLQNVKVFMLPDGANPIKTETQEQTIDILYKENLEVTIEAGDLPISINCHQIYKNIFRYSNGNPTKNWAKPHVGSYSYLIQELLMQNFVTQYTSPSWNLSGSFIGYAPFKFNNVIQHIIQAITVTIVNEEFTNTTGWTNFGSGASWAASSGNTKVKVTASAAGDTKYFIQSATVSIPAGIRMSVASSIQRTLTGSARSDSFFVVLFKNGAVVQLVNFHDFSADETFADTNIFYTLNDADNIGFYIKNNTGSANSAAYEVDYFRVTGLATTRYYYPDSLSREEKGNINTASLVQIFPTV